jgi:hypothetical protein
MRNADFTMHSRGHSNRWAQAEFGMNGKDGGGSNAE